MSSCSIINRPHNKNHKLLHPHCHTHTRANLLLFVLLGFSQITGVYDGTSDETLISTEVFFMAVKFVAPPDDQIREFVFSSSQAGWPLNSCAPTCSCSGADRGCWRVTAGCSSSAWPRPRRFATPSCPAGMPAWHSRGCCSRSVLNLHILTWNVLRHNNDLVAQNAHKPNLPPVSSLNSNSSWSHQLNKSKANEVARGLPSHVSDSFDSRSGNQSEWH